MSRAKNYSNQPTFKEAIQKIKVARFYGPRCRTVPDSSWHFDQTNRLEPKLAAILLHSPLPLIT